MAIKKDAVKTQKTPTTETVVLSSADEMKKAEEEQAIKDTTKKYNTARKNKLKENGLTQISVILDETVYETIKRLASYRAGKNDKLEGSSIQGIINIALREYLDTNMEELNYWDKMAENVPKPKKK